ncbi:MAG TPA: photosynthetic reaction center cytochrome c subunit family protein [Bryobacteraceae bacterium]|nr:photosynthetic reaction center cytochrome c subunit family protein [Bryobacteraceae bacterium]
MKLRSKRVILAVGGMVVVWMAGAGLVGGQTTPAAKPQLAEEAFHNIQVLRGIPVDDFMGTMGVMSAALGFDCSECHTGAGTDRVDWAADTQRKVIARRMVTMVAAINKDNFTGRQMVTCWSCHRGRDKPAVTPSMDIVYGTPSLEADDVFRQAPGQPTAEQILDKYIQAVGGAQRLAGLTSYIAHGTSVGFGGFGGGGQVQIFAKAPDQRTTLIEFKDAPDRGDSIRTFNGRAGWIKTPLAVLKEYQISGGDLDGFRLDAQLAFPGQIKQILKNWRVSLPSTIEDLPGPSSQTSQQPELTLGSHDVQVVQGDRPNGVVATLYFDSKSGLLLRELRYSRSPIGRVPTQIDYSDYRDVNGIKMPYRLTFAWLDGRDSIEIKDVQVNVPIPEAKFGTPEQVKGQ